MPTFNEIAPIPSIPDFERVADGFFYNFRLRPACQEYLPLALGHGMLEVRAAFGDRRPRYQIIPTSPAVRVSPTGFYEEQFNLLPGTIIWGIGVASAVEADVINLNNYSLRLTDLQTNQQLFSEFIGLRSFSLTDSLGSPFILPEPNVVLGPGLMFAEIGAYMAGGVDSETLPFQIILFCSEPISPCNPSDIQRQGGRV